jgi:hypothetical protein
MFNVILLAVMMALVGILFCLLTKMDIPWPFVIELPTHGRTYWMLVGGSALGLAVCLRTIDPSA